MERNDEDLRQSKEKPSGLFGNPRKTKVNPKKPYNDNDNDNDNDSDSDSDSENKK